MTRVLLKIADAWSVGEIATDIGGDGTIDRAADAFNKLLRHNKISIPGGRDFDGPTATARVMVFEILEVFLDICQTPTWHLPAVIILLLTTAIQKTINGAASSEDLIQNQDVVQKLSFEY